MANQSADLIFRVGDLLLNRTCMYDCVVKRLQRSKLFDYQMWAHMKQSVRTLSGTFGPLPCSPVYRRHITPDCYEKTHLIPRADDPMF